MVVDARGVGAAAGGMGVNEAKRFRRAKSGSTGELYNLREELGKLAKMWRFVKGRRASRETE